MSEVGETPQRGPVMTIILTLFTLTHILGLVDLALELQRRTEHGQQLGFAITAMVIAIIAFIGLVGIWMWRRWGVDIVVTVAVIDLIISAFAGVPFLALLIRIVLLVLLGSSIAQRWQSFH